jgi:DUF971 family protein
MKPKQLKVTAGVFEIAWENGETWKIPVDYLRDECPCAGCKGETILLHTYRPVNNAPKTPEMYQLKGIQPVGGYAVQLTWKDGHDSGIYSWEYLKQLVTDSTDGKKQDYESLL